MTIYEIRDGSEVLLETTDISKIVEAFSAWETRLPNIEAFAVMTTNITDSLKEQKG